MKRKNKLSWLQRKVAAWLRPILDIHYQAKEWNMVRCPSCDTPAAAQDALYCRKCGTPLHPMHKPLSNEPTTLEMDARIIKAIASRETGALRKLYIGDGQTGGTAKIRTTLAQRKLIKDMHEFVNR